MKVNRRYHGKNEGNTFSISLLLTSSDVKNILLDSLDMQDESLSEDWWHEALGGLLSIFGPGSKPLSIKPQVGDWALKLAKRYKYLIPDGREEDLLKRNVRLLETSRPGRNKQDADDDE